MIEHEKTGQVHQQITDGIIDCRGMAQGAAGDHAKHQVAGMGNARISQQTFDVVLDQGRQVTDGHGSDGQNSQRPSQLADVNTGQADQPQQQNDRADFRQGGNKGGGFVGGALVDIRGPEMHGEQGKLVEKSAQQQDHPDHSQGL